MMEEQNVGRAGLLPLLALAHWQGPGATEKLQPGGVARLQHSRDHLRSSSGHIGGSLWWVLVVCRQTPLQISLVS